MPQCLKNVCFAVPVLKVYVVMSFLPVKSVKSSLSTIKCTNPVALQMLQLQWLANISDGAHTVNDTALQWQAPLWSVKIKKASLNLMRSLVCHHQDNPVHRRSAHHGPVAK